MRLENLLSLRAMAGGLVLGFIFVLPFSLIWGRELAGSVVTVLFALGFLVGYVGQVFIPLYCDRCRQRLPWNWNVCTRCGLEH